MLLSCGTLGLDWERTSLSMYYEACEAHSIANDPKSPKAEPVADEFKSFMKGRFAKG